MRRVVMTGCHRRPGPAQPCPGSRCVGAAGPRLGGPGNLNGGCASPPGQGAHCARSGPLRSWRELTGGHTPLPGPPGLIRTRQRPGSNPGSWGYQAGRLDRCATRPVRDNLTTWDNLYKSYIKAAGAVYSRTARWPGRPTGGSDEPARPRQRSRGAHHRAQRPARPRDGSEEALGRRRGGAGRRHNPLHS